MVDDPPRTSSRLGEALELERLGWKEAGRNAIASRPEDATVLHRVAHWHRPGDGMRRSSAALAQDDERAVHAVSVRLEDGASQLGASRALTRVRAMSPGRLIVEASLERAFAIA